MKRCPECRRDYTDDTLSFCLEDGTPLVYGVSGEPSTAIMSGPGAVATGSPAGEAPAQPQNRTNDQTALLHTDGGSQKNLNVSTQGQNLSTKRATRPIVMLAVIIILIGGFLGYRYFGSSARQIESIAVMPFANEGGNPDVEYLSDGLTEALIGSLSKLSQLSVKSRSAVFSYKGRETSAKQIGDDLGVQAVLLGRLVQRGENIKLTLELVNAKTQDVIWSEQYDRKQADLVNLQSEIASDVSSKLRSKLSGADRTALDKKYTSDPEAYRLYLQGRFYLNKRVGKEYKKAEAFLRQAIERDPNFALAYVGLAEFVGQQDRPKAKEYILKAIAIDNELSEAHSALGYQFMLDREWAASGRELARAIELDPNNARAHQSTGTRALMIGKYDECLREIDKALALEPTLADLNNNRGSCLVAAGRVDEGIAQVRRAIELDREYAWSYSHLSFLLRMKGDHAGSVEMRARAIEMLDGPVLAARLRDAFRQKGWAGYLHELLAQTTDSFRSQTRRASILAELGEKEESFKSLDGALAQSDWWLFSIKYDPAFDQMRSDPRFQDLLKKFEPPQ